jgi:hypothetical protein
MSTYSYKEILNDVVNRVQNLSPDEQEQFLDELAAVIHQRITSDKEPVHSLLELEGLGAEIWQGIDAQKYVEEERKSWRG